MTRIASFGKLVGDGVGSDRSSQCRADRAHSINHACDWVVAQWVSQPWGRLPLSEISHALQYELSSEKECRTHHLVRQFVLPFVTTYSYLLSSPSPILSSLRTPLRSLCLRARGAVLPSPLLPRHFSRRCSQLWGAYSSYDLTFFARWNAYLQAIYAL